MDKYIYSLLLTNGEYIAIACSVPTTEELLNKIASSEWIKFEYAGYWVMETEEKDGSKNNYPLETTTIRTNSIVSISA